MTDPALRDGEGIVATTSELIGLAGVGGEEPRTLDWIAAWLSDRVRHVPMIKRVLASHQRRRFDQLAPAFLCFGHQP